MEAAGKMPAEQISLSKPWMAGSILRQICVTTSAPLKGVWMLVIAIPASASALVPLVLKVSKIFGKANRVRLTRQARHGLRATSTGVRRLSPFCQEVIS